MRALVMAQPPEAADAFVSGIRDAEPQVRVLASAGWRKVSAVPEEAVPALIEALHDPEIQVRANAAHALGRLDPLPDEAVPLLVECVSHPDAGLRLNAALALQAFPGRAVANALRPLLDDPNLRIRLISARRVLTEEPADPEAIAVAANALVAPASGLRTAALELVASVPLARPTILGLMRDRLAQETDIEVRGFIGAAIEQLERVAHL